MPGRGLDDLRPGAEFHALQHTHPGPDLRQCCPAAAHGFSNPGSHVFLGSVHGHRPAHRLENGADPGVAAKD